MLDLIVTADHNGTCIRDAGTRHLYAWAFVRPNGDLYAVIDKTLSPAEKAVVRLTLAHAMDLDDAPDLELAGC